MKLVFMIAVTLGLSFNAFALSKPDGRTSDAKCTEVAKADLARNANRAPETALTANDFDLVQSTSIGDAGSAIEILLFKRKDTGTMSLIQLWAEPCMLRSIESL